MTESRKYVVKETLVVLLGEAVGLALMFGVYALLKKFSIAVVLGGLVGEQFAAHPQVLMQLDSFTVLRMINLITGAMMMPVTKEQLMELNAKLNTIAL